MPPFIRPSKFRNVYGAQSKRDECYDDLRISNNCGVDSNLISANSTFLSVNWQTSTGGAFAVIPLSQKGRVPTNYPLFCGHTSAVIETAFSPFYEHAIASGSDDGRIMLWNIPQDEIVSQTAPALRLGDVAADGTIYGHTRRIQNLVFHPIASDVLASSSIDKTVKIWDVKKGVYVSELLHPDGVVNLSFNLRGDLLASTCRDKILRIFDSRSKSSDDPAFSFPIHEGGQTTRAVFAGDNENYIITTGSSRTADRQINVFDFRNKTEPVQSISPDKSSGSLIPHFDRDCNVLYLAAKGDGFFSYFEFVNGRLDFLNSHRTSEPLKGIAYATKRSCQTSRNEIMRIYKAHNNWVEQISFIVPRKAGGLQADLYPDTLSCTPAMTAEEFFEGKNAEPIFVPITELHSSIQNLTLEGTNNGTETPKLSHSVASSMTSPMSPSFDAERERLMQEIATKDSRISDLETELSECKMMLKALKDSIATQEPTSEKVDPEL